MLYPAERASLGVVAPQVAPASSKDQGSAYQPQPRELAWSISSHRMSTVGDSSAFQWNSDRDEQFVDFAGLYDLREARRIIQERPRPVEEWATTGTKGELLRDAIESTRLKDDVDWNMVNDDVPIIFAKEPGGGIIIDGHHRLKKRLDRGAETVPVVVLSEEETNQIRRPWGGANLS